MKCSNCGSEMTPIDGHCSICGTPILQEVEYKPVEEVKDEPSKRIYNENKEENNSIDYQDRDLDVARENIIWQIDKELEKIQKKKEESAGKKKFDGKMLLGMLLLCIALMVVFRLNQNQGVIEIPDIGDESATSSGTGVYQSTATELFQVDGVIYNNAGESLEGLYEEDSYTYHFSYDKEHSSGVFIDNRENALYVTADLKTIPIAASAVRAEISLNGDYAYCVTEVNYDDFLYLYNIKSGEKTLIDKDITNYVVLSPDGTTVAYMKYADSYTVKNLYVAGIDKEPTLIVENVNDIRAVSNDGETVYYKVYDEEYQTHEYVWTEGEVITLSDNFPSYFCFNNDCTEVIYKDRDHNYYYGSGMSEPQIFENLTFYEIEFDVPKREVSEYEYDSTIYDSDDFSGALIKTYDNGIYMLDEEYSITEMGKNNYGIGIHRRQDDKDIYIVVEGKDIVRKTVDADKNMESQVLASEVRVNELTTNDDGTLLWYTAYADGQYRLYQIDEQGNESALLDDKEVGTYNAVKWDTATKKLYVLCEDNCLYAITSDGDIEEITNKCHYLRDENYKYPGALSYEDTYGKEYISVFGRFIILQD